MSSEDIWINRRDVLITALMTLAGAAIWFVPGSPFHAGFYLVALCSSLMHGFIYAAFPRLKRRHFVAAYVANIVLLACALHFTGGIVSPFVICLLTILLSGAGYDVLPKFAVPLTMGSYAGVVLLEYAGVLPTVPISTGDVYGSPFAFAMVLMATAAFIQVSGKIYEITVHHLRRQVEQEHARVQETLLRISKVEAQSHLGVTVSKIVHDLRGPVGAVAGFLESLESDSGLQTGDKEDCAVMRSELRRVNELLNRMLKFVKPGGNAFETCDLVEIVDNVLAVLRFSPGAWNIRFDRDLPPPGSCRVSGDRVQLQQVFFNLAKNAVEAFKDRPGQHCIQVRMAERSGEVDAVVRDNGPGMPAEVLHRIGIAQYSSKTDGGGLGLIIVREIVEAHGGKISFRNCEEGGTEVRLSIPALSRNPVPQAAA